MILPFSFLATFVFFGGSANFFECAIKAPHKQNLAMCGANTSRSLVVKRYGKDTCVRSDKKLGMCEFLLVLFDFVFGQA